MLPLCLCYGMRGLFFQFMHKFQKMEISIDLTGLRMFHAPVQNMLTVWTGFAHKIGAGEPLRPATGLLSHQHQRN